MEQEEREWARWLSGESQTAIQRLRGHVSRSPREAWVVEGSERHGIKEVTGPAGYCSDLQTSAVICHSSAVYWLGYPLLQEALLIPTLAVIPQPSGIFSP